MAKGRRLPSLPIAVKRPLATLPIEMRSILPPVAGSTISIEHVPLVIVPLNSMSPVLANAVLLRLMARAAVVRSFFMTVIPVF
ncbi:hypothetical protein D3C76_1415860 [compost metagenome]